MNIVINGVSVWNKYQLIVYVTVCQTEEMFLQSDLLIGIMKRCGDYLIQYNFMIYYRQNTPCISFNIILNAITWATCFDPQRGHHQASTITNLEILVHKQLVCLRDPVRFV
jgi:hypothetical protein